MYGAVTAAFALTWHLCASEVPDDIKPQEPEPEPEPEPQPEPEPDEEGEEEVPADGDRALSSPPASPRLSAAPSQPLVSSVAAKANKRRGLPKKIEWRVFREPSVWATFFMHLAENNAYYAMMQLSPQIFTDHLGVAPSALPRFLSVRNSSKQPQTAGVLREACGRYRRR